MQDGVSGAIGGSGASVRLTTLAVLERLSTERALVDLAFLCAGEGYAKVFEFNNGAIVMSTDISMDRDSYKS